MILRYTKFVNHGTLPIAVKESLGDDEQIVAAGGAISFAVGNTLYLRAIMAPPPPKATLKPKDPVIADGTSVTLGHDSSNVDPPQL